MSDQPKSQSASHGIDYGTLGVDSHFKDTRGAVPAAPDRCEIEGCDKPALCSSGNASGRLVCRDHFMLINSGAALGAVETPQSPPDQAQLIKDLIRDTAEIRSSYGYLLMRLAVAKDAQDAYDVAKREFTEHEAAMQRLESLPAYGSPEWHALGVAAPPALPAPQQQEREQIHAAEVHGGNIGGGDGIPFYLYRGQREPEYDQGDCVVVWYDDLYDLDRRARAALPAPPDVQALQQELKTAYEMMVSILEEQPMANGEYVHLVYCSGSRRHPPGEPGHSCCCLRSKKAALVALAASSGSRQA